MWTLIYVLPLLFVLVAVSRTDYSGIVSWIQTTFVGIEDTFVYSTFADLFGEDGVLPLFTGNLNILMYYFVYFVIAWISHIFVDFLVFIPRFAHKMMDKFCGGDE